MTVPNLLSASPMTLNLHGTFYPAFTAGKAIYSEEDHGCIQRTVARLKSIETSADRPGMLLGKIQSGKTKTFLGVIALAFDNGFDVSIILTKGTKALARQTLQRVRREFGSFQERDALQVHDILSVPGGLTGYELNQKLIIVAKKQSDNLDRLAKLFREKYPQLSTKRALIIDDEADFASVGFRNTQAAGLTSNVTTNQIDQLRTLLKSSAFLQVTATPYSLYLQPESLKIAGNEFKPIRPAFTELVPVHEMYIGSDYYFDQSREAESIASLVYQPLTIAELTALRKEDRRRFKVEDCLTTPVISSLRSAVCNFLVGAVIRRLQDQHDGVPLKKFSFLVHTEAQRAAHAWQERLVIAINDGLTASVSDDPTLLRELLTTAYRELASSVQRLDQYLPSEDETIASSIEALRNGWLMITKVNSEAQVEELLDDEGQLRLRTPLNLFIGGQILDRGITIANLIGFFYGRKPQVYQQDTVLQHSRMFGFRPIQDLTVTRFYTEPQIHDAMRRMHESDVALRDGIAKNPESPVVFIQRDGKGQIIPCNPNKILASNTTTIRPFKRILPVGFQTDYAIRTKDLVKEVDEMLAGYRGADPDEPFEIPLSAANYMLLKIERTIIMEEDEGYFFDWEAARATLAHMSNSSRWPQNRGMVWCIVRSNREMSRRVAAGSHGVYADAPDTAKTEGALARKTAIDTPMLMLFRQNGAASQGWRDTPFYWPVIVAPQETQTAIFAHKTM